MSLLPLVSHAFVRAAVWTLGVLETFACQLSAAARTSYSKPREQTREETTQQSVTGTYAINATIGALTGDVTLDATNKVNAAGANLVAPLGDVYVTGKAVSLTQAREQTTQQYTYAMSQSGISVGVSNPVVDAINNVTHIAEAASRTDSSRMQGLALAAATLTTQKAISAVNADPQSASNASLSISVGAAKVNYTSTEQSDTAVNSKIVAGGDVTIKATGAGADSTVTVRGTDVTAGGNVLLKADGKIFLEAAQNTTESTTQKSSSSASVGLNLNFGTNPGATVGIASSKGSGNSQGESTTWSNTHINAGSVVTLDSGGDTVLNGAVVSAPNVTGEIGGNLVIGSLQDTSTFTFHEKSSGFLVSVPLQGTGGGASVSNGKTSIDSTYASVTEQSAIRAGDGGYQVSVKGDVNLVGGAITSTDSAVQGGKDSLTYGGVLNTSDIQNSASFSAKSTGATVSTTLLGSSGGIGTKSGNASSVTASAISGVAGDASARTGDAQSGIKPIFDSTKVLDDINAQVRITGASSTQAYTAVSTYTANQRKYLQDQIQNATTDQGRLDAQKQLRDLNTGERALNILIGLVTGNAGAAITREGLSAAADQMRGLMIEDSKKFAGITDGTTTLSNISGPSAGVQGDGVKLGGTRIDLDGICGADNARCKSNPDGSLELDQMGHVQFNSDAAGVSLAEFLNSPEGTKMSGLTGGIQGAKGTLFGVTYQAGSWQDRLIESFSGTHDMIGGIASGLYDDQGNIKRGMSSSERNVYDYAVTTTAIAPSAPFAAAVLLPPEVWQVISIILKATK